MSVSKRELWTALSLYGDPAVAGVDPPGPRRRNKHPEQGLLNAVMTALRTHPKVAWVVRMNSGAYKTNDGRFVRFGFVGCPDLLGMMRDGRILMIECKSDRGRVSEAQQVVLETVRANNGVCGVVRSIQDAIDILDGK